jgi:hypothetical protein
VIAGGVLLALLTLGFVVALRRLSRLRARQDFLTEFTDRFMRYVNSGGKDEGLYVELTQRVSRMQRELGHHGIMAMYRPPYANYAFRDYQIIVNMLPQYRQAAHDEILQRNQALQYADAMRDVLVRYSGTLQELETDARRDLKSPVVWFRDGVRALLSLPLVALRELGILSPSLSASILGSGLLKVGAGVVALVTLVAGIVQILTGWDATVALIRRWLGLP